MAAALEFVGVSGLNKCVITLGRENIDRLLLQDTGSPIQERALYGGQAPGNEDYQFQFPSVRIFLTHEQSTDLMNCLDRLHQDLQNL